MRSTTIAQVPVTVESIDEGDAFVLDVGTTLYVFHGAQSSNMERIASSSYAQELVHKRYAAKMQIVTTDDAPEHFWSILGTTGKEHKGKPLHRVDSLHPSTINRIYRVKGDNNFELIAQGREVSDSVLKSTGVYIVDMCHTVFIWVGRDSSPYLDGRRAALHRGVQYLQKHSALHVPLVRVGEGAEGNVFEDLFL